MRALFFVGNNQYHVGSAFMDGIRADLKSLGVDSDTLHFQNEDHIQTLLDGKTNIDEYDFIVSYNGIGFHLAKAWPAYHAQLCRANVFVLLVDHPIYNLTRFKDLNTTVLCVDKEHVAFCQLMGINAIYFPHAVAKHDINEHRYIDYADKEDEIIFPVSYGDEFFYREKLAPIWSDIGGIVDQLTNITHFMQCLGALPLPGEPEQVKLNDDRVTASQLVDQYLRVTRRNEILQQYAQKGIRLTVIGRDAHKYKDVCDFHHYEAAMDYAELQERIRHARYVLHQSPGFVQGLHERVVMPLSLGTLVICDEPFIRRTLPNTISSAELPMMDDVIYEYKRDICITQIHNDHTWQVQWEALLKSLAPSIAA